eukprot:50668_1
MSSSKSRYFAPHNDGVQISVVELIRHKIQNMIDNNFGDSAACINELAKHFNGINNEDKKAIINFLYKYDFDDSMLPESILDVPLVTCITQTMLYKDDTESEFKHIINFFVEQGMNLMSCMYDEGPCVYDSLWDFQEVGFDFSFQIDMINKYTQHPFHFNYFKENGYLSLITIPLKKISLPFHSLFLSFDNIYSCHHLFGSHATANACKFTVENIRKCVQSLHGFNFISFIHNEFAFDFDLMMPEAWKYNVQQNFKVFDVSEIIEYFSGYLNEMSKSTYLHPSQDLVYLFIMTEMIKLYQQNILAAIKELNVPNIMIDIIGQFTLR